MLKRRTGGLTPGAADGYSEINERSRDNLRHVFELSSSNFLLKSPEVDLGLDVSTAMTAQTPDWREINIEIRDVQLRRPLLRLGISSHCHMVRSPKLKAMVDRSVARVCVPRIGDFAETLLLVTNQQWARTWCSYYVHSVLRYFLQNRPWTQSAAVDIISSPVAED